MSNGIWNPKASPVMLVPTKSIIFTFRIKRLTFMETIFIRRRKPNPVYPFYISTIADTTILRINVAVQWNALDAQVKLHFPQK